MNSKIAPLIFLDAETTGLNPIEHRAWDIALIARTPMGDYEYQAFVDFSDLNFEAANQRALEIGDFGRWGRAGTNAHKREAQIVNELIPMLSGAIIAGANPWFDASSVGPAASFIGAMFARQGERPVWDYHLLDVESYAAGAIGAEPPWKLDDLLNAYGITYPAGARHTALGDCRIERDLYDCARPLRRFLNAPPEIS